MNDLILALACYVLSICYCPVVDLPEPYQKGWSTFYGLGERWHGRVRADGKPFDPSEYIIAHRTIPLGSKVIIKGENGNMVGATVSDRGPYGAMIEDRWAVMYYRRKKWHVMEKDGTVWTAERKPGRYRGIADLSVATAQALYQTSSRPPNGRIEIYLDKEDWIYFR